ncbi:hypothetical protein GJAV_G00047520 [Gymnothorax javanicus]|nr:hypothetical protein GJAV_G00047520 [Gymnothorax javanicus]
MKTVLVVLVLLATVYCQPVKRSASSAESSEEVVIPSQLQLNADPPQTAGSDESTNSSDESQQSDTASEDSADTDEDDSDSDESDEPVEPTTESPVPFETTLVPATSSGRGDHMGYPSEYKKSIIYVDTNQIGKDSGPYKYYEMEKAEESMGLMSKKASVYDSTAGNDVEKTLKVYKVHNEFLEGDTSTPEVESQGLGEEPTIQQADLTPETATAESASTAESTSDSTSEEEEESQSSQSSEEATAAPGESSDSSQSSESQDNSYSDYSEPPIIVAAK